MAFKIYNTLNRKIEEFIPIKKDVVTLYTCGPTVYNYVHIGNLRAMLSYDIVRRYLIFKGYKIKHVMNITDVDDKTIKGSINEGKTLKEFTEFYTHEFFKDLNTLGIERAEIVPNATDEIDSMVKMIEILEKKGHAYRSEKGDIYFKISSFKEYGNLAKLDLDKLKKNADGRLDNADEYEKEDARDFALWKLYEKEDGDVFWDTSIGKGRPGWHTECCAMSHKYLGLPIDIHMGGVDLVFPHHTNEIAQAEAAYGKKFVNYWMHNEHLIVNGQKMSKSLGNFFTLRDLLEKGYEPKAIRYELLSTNYRQKLDFKEENLKKIPETLKRFDEFLDKLNHIKKTENNKQVKVLINTVKEKFEKEMDNDLNISGALASIFVFMTEVNKIMEDISINDANNIKDTLMKFDSVLGIMTFKKQEIPKEIINLAEKRLLARQNKDWDASDKIRYEINSKGYFISDEKEGYRIKISENKKQA